MTLEIEQDQTVATSSARIKARLQLKSAIESAMTTLRCVADYKYNRENEAGGLYRDWPPLAVSFVYLTEIYYSFYPKI